jgi:membrane-associated protease RseP (regulator of RpoE activity)
MQKNSLIIPVVFLLIGFISAYFIFGSPLNSNDSASTINNEKKVTELFSSINPFAEKRKTPAFSNPDFNNPAISNQSAGNRLDYFEDEISQIKQQLKEIEQTLSLMPDTAAGSTNPASKSRNRFSTLLPRRLYNFENLLKGGIASTIAEDIVRRKSSVELKRLELQDRAKRDNYLNTQRYYDELDDINQHDVNLREELGDESYDEYLYASKQNNRIKIASVMLGSAAEHSGIQQGDVVLSYDNKRMFSWQELKDATTEGQLGEFVAINIVRNGEIYSFTVPRGPLGTQLGTTRLAP